jgi:hypothetical protein
MAAGARLADEAVAAGGAFVLGDDGVGLGVGESTVDVVQNLGVGEARIAQPGGFGARERGLAGIAATRLGQNDIVGKSGKLHGLRFTGERPKLIEVSQRHYGFFLKPGAHHAGDASAILKRLIVTAGNIYQVHAILVGKSGLTGLGQLRDFSLREIEGAQLLNALEIHAGLFERGVVRLGGGFAAWQGKEQAQEGGIGHEMDA